MNESTLKSSRTEPQLPTAGAHQRGVGSALGNYRLDRLISQGGLAAVFEARHRFLDRRAAAKVPLEANTEFLELVAPFRSEARILAKIEHPNAVKLLDFGEDDDGPFLILEYLAGETVADRLARTGPFPALEAARIVLELVSVLAEIHANGIVHRDIKPANVLLVPARQGPELVKLLDFGISLDVREIGSNDEATCSPDGTPGYMAPEQISASREIDGRADQFSLAVMAYELLSGRPAFRIEPGRTLAAARGLRLGSVFSDDPAMSERIDSVLQRATSPQPRDRYENVVVFGEALEEAVASCPRSTVAPQSGIRELSPHTQSTLRATACSSWS